MATVRATGREQRGEDVLGRGLAGAAGDGHHLAPAAPAHARWPEPAAPRSPSSTTIRGAAGGRSAAVSARTTTADAPPRQRLRRRSRRRRNVLAAQADEQLARRCSVRLSMRDAADHGPRVAALQAAAAGGRDVSASVSGQHRPHHSPRQLGQQLLRATVRVVERDAPVADDLALLVTLAGDDARRRRRGPRAERQADGRAPVGLDDHAHAAVRPGTPARISSMMASGILAARVVGGHERRRSARRAPISPMSGRLPRSRSPPQPNTTSTRPAAMARAGAQRVLERVGRVRVVDDHGERLARRARPRTRPGHALGARQTRRSTASSGSPSARQAVAAASAFSTLKRAARRSSTCCCTPSRGDAEREARTVGAQVEVARQRRRPRTACRRRPPAPPSATANVQRSSPYAAGSRRQPPAVLVAHVHDRPRARPCASHRAGTAAAWRRK